MDMDDDSAHHSSGRELSSPFLSPPQLPFASEYGVAHSSAMLAHDHMLLPDSQSAQRSLTPIPLRYPYPSAFTGFETQEFSRIQQQQHSALLAPASGVRRVVKRRRTRKPAPTDHISCVDALSTDWSADEPPRTIHVKCFSPVGGCDTEWTICVPLKTKEEVTAQEKSFQNHQRGHRKRGAAGGAAAAGAAAAAAADTTTPGVAAAAATSSSAATAATAATAVAPAPAASAAPAAALNAPSIVAVSENAVNKLRRALLSEFRDDLLEIYCTQSDKRTLVAAADDAVIDTAIRTLGKVATEARAHGNLSDEWQPDGDYLLHSTLDAVHYLSPRAYDVARYYRRIMGNKDMVPWLQARCGDIDGPEISPLLLASLPENVPVLGEWSQEENDCFLHFWQHDGGLTVFRSMLQGIADMTRHFATYGDPLGEKADMEEAIDAMLVLMAKLSHHKATAEQHLHKILAKIQHSTRRTLQTRMHTLAQHMPHGRLIKWLNESTSP